MEKSAIKVFGIDAVILVAGKENLTAEHLSPWKNCHTGKEVIHPDRETPEKTSSRRPGKIKDLLKSVIQHLQAPSKRLVLVSEDPLFISAAKRLGLAMVIGISGKTTGKRKLYEKGANIVLQRLEDVSVYMGDDESACSFTQHLPNVFTDLNKFETPFRDREPVFFLDYDGTLAPIVRDPASAFLPDHTRDLLRGLSNRYTVAVVSGRDMDDIIQFVSLDRIIYAGSHGFRISGPDGLYMEHEEARPLLAKLDQFEKHLRETVEKQIEGVEVERKYFAIAVHYRNAPPGSLERIKKEADHLIGKQREFKKGRGKKILELRPSLEWHKGKAVEWIMQKLELSDTRQYIPVYIGDDVTDEDAFRTIADDGIGILVGTHSLPSAANYQLKDVDQVNKFLHYMVHTV